ncbi:MAG: thermonuclease family protein [Leptolyngbyaceae cyanobacterium MO_188.B28]|nr:thermonuclease family protein [Leptolyngbyaceae cyanobacterium MO_188.B28]
MSACQPLDSPKGPLVSVDRVINGQVLEVVTPVGPPPGVYKVRLEGIDAPDLRQKPWGEDAKQYLNALIANHPIRIEPARELPDRYDRLWAYVWLDKKLLNEQLTAVGHALVRHEQAVQLKYGKQLIRAQERARLGGLGVWRPENPMRETPQEFRKHKQ